MTLSIRNGQVVAAAELPRVDMDLFRDIVIGHVEDGARVAALHPFPDGDRARLLCVLAHDRDGHLTAISSDVGGSYSSLTPECPQAHWFERELYERNRSRMASPPRLGVNRARFARACVAS